MAFDISITKEMREKQDKLINDIIQSIENVKINVRNEKPNEKIEASVQLTTVLEQSAKAFSTSTKAITPTPLTAQIPPIGHIFISYSHQNSKRAMQLRDMLRERGLPVWFDAEAIRGNSIEAMVLGLNDARLVIMCLSDGYRQSDFCKREAEYTVLKKKPFQPVIMQEGFRMENDWLCFVVGLQNWIDLSGEKQFNSNRAQFLDHVHHLFANGTSNVPSTPSPITTAAAASIVKSHAPGLGAPRPPSGRPKSGQLPPLSAKTVSESQVARWKTEQVLKWLDEEQLGAVKEKHVY